jgi:hypothetical protein
MTEILVDLSSWKMKQHTEWTDLLREPLTNITAVNEMMIKVVKRWPFEGDPADIEAYDDLDPLEWRAAFEAVGKATRAAFQKPGDELDKSDKVRKAGHDPA